MAPWLRPLLLAALVALPATAEEREDVPELSVRAEKLHVTYVVNPDGSHVETRERALKVLHERAIEYAKQAQVSHSTSVERAEVLEAYTRKPDGRRIEVPQSNYQLRIDQGREGSSPAFSDRTRLTVVFPDVAVGDVLVWKYRVTETEPMFPGRFSVDERFNRAAAYDDVVVRIDVPAALGSKHAVTDMDETLDETRDGRRTLEWRWTNPTPPRSKRRDYSVYDPEKEPGYAFSTFRTHGEIAAAYGERARPKAAPTDRVRKLASEITQGVAESREQTRLLYEWVAQNIDYAGNCIGVGAVVPRDQSFVLDNHMGDCKDQATLLQALLASKGIESTQALVNSGNVYRLPSVPVVAMVNHVILYVPSLDLYLDPTSESTPFGMLPMGDSDKPVLWVDGAREAARTPPMNPAANRQVARSEVALAADGSVSGTVQVSSSGFFATWGRDRLRDVTNEARDEFVNRMYRRDNQNGFGRLEHDDPKPLRDTFSYKVSFQTEDFAQVPGPGAFSIAPLYPTEAPIAMLVAEEEEEEVDETACFGGTVVEEYVFELSDEVEVLAVPKNVTLSAGAVSYRATYSLDGRTLTARRELVDSTDRNVCPIAIHREWVQLARKIMADLKAQVVYR
jgi:transglutaminase-like putative cysteine protease